MLSISFTPNLRRFFPDLDKIEIEVGTVMEALSAANERFPGIIDYIVDDQRRLRSHVNVFVDGDPIADRDGLGDDVEAASEIYVMQALSGG